MSFVLGRSFSSGRSGVVLSGSKRGRAAVPLTLVSTLVLGAGLWAGSPAWDPAGPAAMAVPGPAASTHAQSVVAKLDPLLSPTYSLGVAARPLSQSAPLTAEWVPSTPPAIARVEPSVVIAAVAPAAPAVEEDEEDEDVASAAPLPLPRPPELRSPEQPRLTGPLSPRRSRVAAAPAAPPADDRSIFEKIFGVQRQPNGPALAYAAPQDDAVGGNPLRGLIPAPAPATPPSAASGQGTAVYNIASRTLTMPNGERLEAHSGLGDRLDDPRYVHERMRGPTPPHVYDLTMREQLFHGVRALRLNPVGGSAAIHGRAGLLAHTFMLGPKGDSNGCVSIRDYDKFLQAYLKGEVKRLVVVAGL
ncbi:DUF2778 domain-containing protein [Alsobacter sp. SYSU BS001988]